VSGRLEKDRQSSVGWICCGCESVYSSLVLAARFPHPPQPIRSVTVRPSPFAHSSTGRGKRLSSHSLVLLAKTSRAFVPRLAIRSPRPSTHHHNAEAGWRGLESCTGTHGTRVSRPETGPSPRGRRGRKRRLEWRVRHPRHLSVSYLVRYSVLIQASQLAKRARGASDHCNFSNVLPKTCCRN